MWYLFEQPERVLELTMEHIRLVGVSVLAATLIGVPLGILCTRIRWLESPILNMSGVLYTVPSLAFFAILIPYTGLGATTATLAPSRANAKATARPMPRPPPVMSAILFASSISVKFQISGLKLFVLLTRNLKPYESLLKRGVRFSKNARTPSRASVVWKQRSCASVSYCNISSSSAASLM